MRLQHLVLALHLCLCPALLSAHGEIAPLRGGLVAWSGELSVEIVRADDGQLHLYVDDHGVPVDVADARASVNIVRDSGRHTAVFYARDGTVLISENSTVFPGDRLQIIVNFPDGRLVVARLTVPQY